MTYLSGAVLCLGLSISTPLRLSFLSIKRGLRRDGKSAPVCIDYFKINGGRLTDSFLLRRWYNTNNVAPVCQDLDGVGEWV